MYTRTSKILPIIPYYTQFYSHIYDILKLPPNAIYGSPQFNLHFEFEL